MEIVKNYHLTRNRGLLALNIRKANLVNERNGAMIIKCQTHHKLLHI